VKVSLLKPHISHIRNRAFSAYNISKSLSPSSCGGDPASLLLFYKSYVRSIIDYGSFLYANAAETTLLLLERVQNHAISLALGATKTTPILVLQAESKIPLLSFGRTKLAHQHTLKPTSCSNTATLKKFLTVHKTWRFIRKYPLLFVISRDLYETNKFIFKTDRYEYKNLPYLEIHHHWPTHYFQFDSTHRTAAQAYQNLAERISSGTEQIHIYTDASKLYHALNAATFVQSLFTLLTYPTVRPNAIFIRLIR